MSCSDTIRNQILSVVGDRRLRITPSALERELCRYRPDRSRKAVRSTIKALVVEGVLSYTNHFNTTHLELNFAQPTQVSDRIILSPHTSSLMVSNSSTRVIKIDHGSAFGIGDHPTTRLCLRAVDFIMAEIQTKDRIAGFRALDIGTGTGVLAMAAVVLGAESAVGIDIEPESLYEAERNLFLNGMEDKITLTSDSLESLVDSYFHLIMANLRPPTLKQMLPLIEKLSVPDAYWVFSGCRSEALEDVAAMLSPRKTKILWKEKSCGWGALAAACKL